MYIILSHLKNIEMYVSHALPHSLLWLVTCGGVTCDCPEPPFACPEDSILVEVRTSPCCVRYDCVCPQASCPVLMECGVAVQPVPSKRGHGYPGYCCPDYNFDGKKIHNLIDHNIYMIFCLHFLSSYTYIHM